ncbi:MAG: S-adenosyl-l-methionine hydroxide adenosyltransferase family protein [Thermoleophilia bacterium]
MSARPVVGLLTDFGPGTEHVGALHAVIAAGCPAADRIDLAHDVPAGDVRAGAVLLARLAALLPAAVHVAVVDPGVGTERRAAAVGLAGGGALVGPDNGLLGPAAAALGATAAVALAAPEGPAATFHGRDLFAPVAARLAAGEPLAGLGDPFDPATLASPSLPPAQVADGSLVAEVLLVDHYGNVQLLAGPADLERAGFTRGDRISATVSGSDRPHPVTVARAFDDVARKGMLVHADSHGMVALAVNGGDAARRIGAAPGRAITLARWPRRATP